MPLHSVDYSCICLTEIEYLCEKLKNDSVCCIYRLHKGLDSNDNSPIFSERTYEVSVSEDTPADTEILRVGPGTRMNGQS